MPPKAFLLASLSGRVLAKAAARAGRPAVGMDAFADRDTQGLAQGWARVPLGPGWRFDGASALEAAERLCPADGCLGLVYGSGFESQPDLLEALARQRPLLGNAPEVLKTLASPVEFAGLLDTLGIPHPETATCRPPEPEGWLRKRAGSCGGSHVDLAEATRDDDPDHYFQRRVQGQEWSLLFLANGTDVRPVGFNRPLLRPAEAPGPWTYAGAVAHAHGPEQVAGDVLAAARALTLKLGLKGLNGLDFMATHGGWTLLELNPRPTATLELWDAAPLPPLFDLHVQACHGRLPVRLPVPAVSRAAGVVFAPRALTIHAAFPWPAWCADIPGVGQTLAQGDPVCTVHASGADPAAAEAATLSRRHEILHRLAGYCPAPVSHPTPAPAEACL